jgi:hypothetical protein
VNDQGIGARLTGAMNMTLSQWMLDKARKARAFFAGRQSDFPGSKAYWEDRYRTGGNSGAGSYGKLAKAKADFINAFVDANKIRTVMEFGCGDGHQLSLSRYPDYIGLDVSPKAIELCRERFAGDPCKRFFLYDPGTPLDANPAFFCDLTLSLDVLYHLIEDEVFETYMRDLFERAKRHVIVYSSDVEENTPDPHVRHRCFTAWVAANQSDWRLQEKTRNPFPYDPDRARETSFADFHVFSRI